jgi:hypothetical protein
MIYVKLLLPLSSNHLGGIEYVLDVLSLCFEVSFLVLRKLPIQFDWKMAMMTLRVGSKQSRRNRGIHSERKEICTVAVTSRHVDGASKYHSLYVTVSYYVTNMATEAASVPQISKVSLDLTPSQFHSPSIVSTHFCVWITITTISHHHLLAFKVCFPTKSVCAPGFCHPTELFSFLLARAGCDIVPAQEVCYLAPSKI